jgi:hypothetical protein
MNKARLRADISELKSLSRVFKLTYAYLGLASRHRVNVTRS